MPPCAPPVRAQLLRHAPDRLRHDCDCDELKAVQHGAENRTLHSPRCQCKGEQQHSGGRVKPTQAAAAPAQPARRTPTRRPTWLLAGPGTPAAFGKERQDPRIRLPRASLARKRKRARNSLNMRSGRRTRSSPALMQHGTTQRLSAGPVPGRASRHGVIEQRHEAVIHV